MVSVELFLVSLFLIFCKIFNFSISSFPARNMPNQNIFEPIKRIVIAIEDVFNPNFKNGIRKISPQKIYDKRIRPMPRI